MVQIVMWHLIFIGLPIFGGIMSGRRGDVEEIIKGAVGSSVVGPALIALGAAPFALIDAYEQAQMQTPPQPHGESCGSCGAIFLGSIFGYLVLVGGLALIWFAWAVILTFAATNRKWLGVVWLFIAVLPLAATVAYVDYLMVFGFAFPLGDIIAEIVRNASPGSVPTTYLTLDPWIIVVLALLTPLAVIAYSAWWLRRIEAAVLAARRAH